MHPLDDVQRRRFLTWSALLCAIPLCLAPLAGRSSFELASEQAAFDARFPAAQLQNVWSEKPVAVARDPFVPEASAPALGDQEMTADGVIGMHVTQGDSMGFVLPANRGAAGTPLGNGASGMVSASVTAIITGSSPRALIDDGDRVRVVAIGDTLGGSRVLRIDRSGVRLQNGTLLALTGNHL